MYGVRGETYHRAWGKISQHGGGVFYPDPRNIYPNLLRFGVTSTTPPLATLARWLATPYDRL